MIYPFYWYQKPMHYISFICKVFKRSLHLLLLIKPNGIITYFFFFFFFWRKREKHYVPKMHVTDIRFIDTTLHTTSSSFLRICASQITLLCKMYLRYHMTVSSLASNITYPFCITHEAYLSCFCFFQISTSSSKLDQSEQSICHYNF